MTIYLRDIHCVYALEEGEAPLIVAWLDISGSLAFQWGGLK